jgi:hypothetical protein
MDPFLESPAVFAGLHNRFIAVLAEVLQRTLPSPYFAEIGERVWVEVSQRFIEPDTSVIHRTRDPSAAGGSVATAETRSRSVVVTVPHDERREPFVEIRTQGDGTERLVTAIELLSPSNKTPGGRGRELYLREQRELLDSPVNLVEIDLLRGGMHSTAVPLDRLLAQVGPFDYHVSVHRFDRFEDFVIYPFRLEDSLPEIQVPLLPADREIPIDLQPVFDRVYDTGPYHRRIRYAEAAIVPPVRPELKECVARLIQNAI